MSRTALARGVRPAPVGVSIAPRSATGAAPADRRWWVDSAIERPDEVEEVEDVTPAPRAPPRALRRTVVAPGLRWTAAANRSRPATGCQRACGGEVADPDDPDPPDPPDAPVSPADPARVGPDGAGTAPVAPPAGCSDDGWEVPGPGEVAGDAEGADDDEDWGDGEAGRDVGVSDATERRTVDAGPDTNEVDAGDAGDGAGVGAGEATGAAAARAAAVRRATPALRRVRSAAVSIGPAAVTSSKRRTGTVCETSEPTIAPGL